MSAVQPAPATSAIARHCPWLMGVVALAPLILYRDAFAGLFWFGDDWDLMDNLARHGVWPWAWTFFNENLVPLFKVIWSSAIVATRGSHLAVLWLIWLNHALNVALLGRLLQRAGFGWIAITLALAVFGLCSSNIETLTWSICWSGVLCTTFFLVSLAWGLRPNFASGTATGRDGAILVLLVTASGLCLSRGVLTGVALAGASLVPSSAAPRGASNRLRVALICLLPSLVIAFLIYFKTANNHAGLMGNLGSIAKFAAWHFSLSPLNGLLRTALAGPQAVALAGIGKLILMTWGLWRTRGVGRQTLAALALFELGDSLLLGIGRHHTGAEYATSSRYQYTALFCTLPFTGFALEQILERWVTSRFFLRTALGAALLSGVAWRTAALWSPVIHGWSQNRGRVTRELLFENPHPPAAGAIPGIPFMSTQRAKELTARYHLH